MRESFDDHDPYNHTRALDRVLQWGRYVIPNWHIGADRLVYWNKFGYPEVTPDDGVQIDAWWVDAAKQRALTGGAASQ